MRFTLALKGERVDGHDFLAEVARKGAIAAVVSEDYSGDHFGMELIQVRDVKRALQDLAKEVFKKARGIVIGITGTVGKTTTKEFLAGILAEKFQVTKTLGSMNSQVGLPLTLLNGDLSADVFVLEMGMSQKGELARLVEIASPELGVLTKISMVHGAFFDSIEEIAAAKCELFGSKRMKRAFLNRDTEGFAAVQGIGVEKEWFGEEIIEGPFKEEHLLETLAGAVCVARYLGLTEADIQRGVSKLKTIQSPF